MIAIMTGNSATHPYSSLWFQWPAMTRPVWYLFHVEGARAATWSAPHPAQAIVALANPLVFYAGEAAILFAAWRWIVGREVDAMIVTVALLLAISAVGDQSEGAGILLLLFPVAALPRAGAGAGVLSRRRAGRANGRRSAFSCRRGWPSSFSCRCCPRSSPSARRFFRAHLVRFVAVRRAFRFHSRRAAVKKRRCPPTPPPQPRPNPPKISRSDPAFWRVDRPACFGGFSTFALLYSVQPLMPVFAREFAISPAGAEPVAVGGDRRARGRDDRRRAPSPSFWDRKHRHGGFARRVLARHDARRAGAGLADAAGACARSPAWRSPACRRWRWPISSTRWTLQAIGLAMGLYIAGSTLGGMSGRLVVAALSDYFGWRPAIAADGGGRARRRGADRLRSAGLAPIFAAPARLRAASPARSSAHCPIPVCACCSPKGSC